MWNKKFHSFLAKFQLKNSSYEKCLYFNADRSILLIVYVDDALIAAKSERLIAQLIDFLQLEVELKILDCKKFLGFNIELEADNIKISQREYIERILERFKLSNANPARTPEGHTRPEQLDSSPLDPQTPFKEALGALLYLSICTRPDIAHAVNIASQTSLPTQAYWSALKRIFRYLIGTKNLGLRYKKNNKLQLEVFTDADYANDQDTRRSASGFVITLNSTPIL